jgi:hypothetical protein
VRHVRLSLARSAIAMERRWRLPSGVIPQPIFGFITTRRWTTLKKSGSIVKVDNSNGANVEIMICDVKSYLTAMYYMMSFNDKDDIIMYWDEPTISLDYETHELRRDKTVWEKNQIPNIILSCATLPDETEIRETLYNFKERFENAEIATIKVMTVKDDFYTGLKFAVRCSPLAVSRLRRIEIVELRRDKSMLRYFDLDEIVKFIKYVRERVCRELLFRGELFQGYSGNNDDLYKLLLLCLLYRQPDWLPYTDTSQICDPERSFQRGRLFPVL